jgi:hypothetical protein
MNLEEAQAEVEQALNDLRPIFTPDVELTFVMRHPAHPECHMVVSNDDLSELSALLARVVEKSS